MAEPSPARRPVPLIESGKTRPRVPSARRRAAAADRPCLLPAELYFLIARYLSAGPCRRAAQVSAGGREGGRTGGRSSSRSRPGLTVRLCRRCWCRSWSSTRSVIRPRVPRPRVPGPARLASRPRWSLGRLSCLFPAVAEEVGLGGQRAQQELRGIGEHRPPVRPRPPRARSLVRPPTRVPSRVSAPVRAPRGRSRGAHGCPGRPARFPLPPLGSRLGPGGRFGRKRSWGRRGHRRGRPWLAAWPGLQVRLQPLRGALSSPSVRTCNSSSHWSPLSCPAQVFRPLVSLE